jgi:hypothetical protein
VAVATTAAVAMTMMAAATAAVVGMMKTMAATAAVGGTDNNSQLKVAVEEKATQTYY